MRVVTILALALLVACGGTDGETSDPSEPEICDGIDNDGDGLIDQEDDSLQAEGALGIYYPDNDGDGFGDLQAGRLLCDMVPGWTEDSTDCDDTRAQVHPGATERCDGLDNDCDESTPDEGVAFESEDGEITDLTELISSSAAPYLIEADTSGVYTFCEGTWSIGAITVAKGQDVQILGIGRSEEVILTGGYQTLTLGAFSTAELRDLRMTEHTGDNGAAVHCAAEAELTVQGVVFEGNESTQTGGAMMISSGCQATLTATRFLDSVSGMAGGHLRIVGGDVEATDCDFSEGLSAAGGAVSVSSIDSSTPSSFTCTGCTFQANEAEVGGALALLQSTATLTDSAIQGGIATSGAGIYLGAGPGAEATANLTTVSFDLNQLNDDPTAEGLSVFAGGVISHDPYEVVTAAYDYEGSSQTVVCEAFAGCAAP